MRHETCLMIQTLDFHTSLQHGLACVMLYLMLSPKSTKTIYGRIRMKILNDKMALNRAYLPISCTCASVMMDANPD